MAFSHWTTRRLLAARWKRRCPPMLRRHRGHAKSAAANCRMIETIQMGKCDVRGSLRGVTATPSKEDPQPRFCLEPFAFKEPSA